MYVVESGRLVVQTTTHRRRDGDHPGVGTGQVVGGLGLLVEGLRRTGSVVALEPAGVHVSAPVALQRTARSGPSGRPRPRRRPHHRASPRSSAQFVLNQFGTLAERVVERLLVLDEVYRHGWIAVTQEGLGSMTGGSRQAVNRVLGDAAAGGLVRVRRARCACWIGRAWPPPPADPAGPLRPVARSGCILCREPADNPPRRLRGTNHAPVPADAERLLGSLVVGGFVHLGCGDDGLVGGWGDVGFGGGRLGSGGDRLVGGRRDIGFGGDGLVGGWGDVGFGGAASGSAATGSSAAGSGASASAPCSSAAGASSGSGPSAAGSVAGSSAGAVSDTTVAGLGGRGAGRGGGRARRLGRGLLGVGAAGRRAQRLRASARSAATSMPNSAATWGSSGPRRLTVASSSSTCAARRARSGRRACAPARTPRPRAPPPSGPGRRSAAATPSSPRRAGSPGRAGNGTPAFGGTRRQAQGPHDAADVERRLDVGEPQRELLVLLGDERRLERGGELARRLVAGDERDRRTRRRRCAGRAGRGARAGAARPRPGRASRRRAGGGAAPRPSSARPPRASPACPRPSGGRCPRAAAGARRPCPAGRARRSGAAPRAVDAEHVGAVLLAGPQALGLRALRQLGRRREVRALAPAVVAARPAAALAARSRSPVAAGRRGRSPVAARSPPLARRRGRAGRRARRRAGRGAAAAGRRRAAAGRPVLDDRLERAPRSGAARARRRGRPSPWPARPTARGCRRCPSRSRPAAGRRPTTPAGRIDPSRTPRGSRAPAARQVHEPSGAELVSSISMRIDMARHRTGSLLD